MGKNGNGKKTQERKQTIFQKNNAGKHEYMHSSPASKSLYEPVRFWIHPWGTCTQHRCRPFDAKYRKRKHCLPLAPSFPCVSPQLCHRTPAIVHPPGNMGNNICVASGSPILSFFPQEGACLNCWRCCFCLFLQLRTLKTFNVWFGANRVEFPFGFFWKKESSKIVKKKTFRSWSRPVICHFRGYLFRFQLKIGHQK